MLRLLKLFPAHPLHPVDSAESSKNAKTDGGLHLSSIPGLQRDVKKCQKVMEGYTFPASKMRFGEWEALVLVAYTRPFDTAMSGIL